VGLTPLEVWGQETIHGQDAYRTVHFGNEITDVRGTLPEAPARGSAAFDPIEPPPPPKPTAAQARQNTVNDMIDAAKETYQHGRETFSLADIDRQAEAILKTKPGTVAELARQALENPADQAAVGGRVLQMSASGCRRSLAPGSSRCPVGPAIHRQMAGRERDYCQQHGRRAGCRHEEGAGRSVPASRGSRPDCRERARTEHDRKWADVLASWAWKPCRCGRPRRA
jgi:hypothetical protein